jgi:hypothetical protein
MSHGIRASLEARRRAPDPEESWWPLAVDIDVEDYRNRLLFTALAGEPTIFNIEPGAPPRGLPDDATSAVRRLYSTWEKAAWAASWVSYAELVTLIERRDTALRTAARANDGDEHALLAQHTSVSMQAILAYLAVYQASGYDVRLIFWFTAF